MPAARAVSHRHHRAGIAACQQLLPPVHLQSALAAAAGMALVARVREDRFDVAIEPNRRAARDGLGARNRVGGEQADDGNQWPHTETWVIGIFRDDIPLLLSMSPVPVAFEGVRS